MKLQPFSNLNLTVVRGVPANIYVPVYYDNGNYADVTGYTFSARVGDWQGDELLIPTCSVVADPDTGREVVLIYFPSSLMQTLTPGVYRWDMLGTSSGVNYALYYGEFTILDLIT